MTAASESAILAIDQGTSATKAVVVAPDGAVLGLAEVSVRPRYSAGGAVELNPIELFESVVHAGTLALDQARVPVGMVTLANQGESVLAWDRSSGEPLSDIVVWQDRRAESICAELHSSADEITQRTGLVLDPYFSAPKQAWLRRNVTRAGVVTTSDSWLLHKLTGEFVTDIATASRSLLTDLGTGQWDTRLLELFGLGDEELPTILASDTLAGQTTAFGAPIPVGGLIVDQQAALLAESCLARGEAKCTFGTGGFLLANAGTEPVRSEAGLATSIAWRTRGETTYCFDGQIYTVASAVEWLRKLGFIGAAADLDRIAEPDADGVLAVPALAGLAAPWWRPDATASFTGMRLTTGPGHLVRATLEGIAAQVAELCELFAIELRAPLRRLRVDGGLTRSRVLMQAVADLTQIEIDVYPSQHATPLGAVALARMAADSELRLPDAVVGWRPTVSYGPQWSADQAADFRARWREAVPR